ncbi:hypothetical protein [Paenibacillus alvei]|uniref:hypothetical protein n=1 Tax=Paenibacillus alvei TaxID=44250 RepID=UPI002282A0DD|nr:hypothetical protein [Paenibacillus alvei]
MASSHIRTEKILKELQDLFQKRLALFDDLKFFALNGNKADLKYVYGQCVGLRRAIHDLLVALSLTDTELYRNNDVRFELNYLTERETELEQLNE